MESAVHPSFGKAGNLCSLTHYHRMTQSPLLFFTVGLSLSSQIPRENGLIGPAWISQL